MEEESNLKNTSLITDMSTYIYYAHRWSNEHSRSLILRSTSICPHHTLSHLILLCDFVQCVVQLHIGLTVSVELLFAVDLSSLRVFCFQDFVLVV